MNTRGRSTRSRTGASRAYRDHSSSSSASSSDSTREADEEESVTSLVPSVASSAVPTSTPGSKGGRPQGKNNPCRSNVQGLKEWEQKLLAADLEAFGGADEVDRRSFRTFCEVNCVKDEERGRLYGTVASKERERVRHKLNTWKRIGYKDYCKLLEQWNVLPAGFEAKGTKAPSKAPSKPPVSVVSTSPTVAVGDISFGLESLSLGSPAKPEQLLKPEQLFPQQLFGNMSDHKMCKSRCSSLPQHEPALTHCFCPS